MRGVGPLRRLWSLGLLVLLVARDGWTTNPPDADSSPTARPGALVIMGGAERFEHREFWDEIVELAGGANARIAVFPTASLDPIRRGHWVIAALNRSGADAFLVPLAWRQVPRDPADVAFDSEIAEEVRNAGGVFFIGGGQERITRALLDEDGRRTPLLDAVWDVYRGGGVIAGTSAGAAIMSRVMYRDPDSVLETLHQGVRMGQEIDHGLGFLPDDWFVDQHCLVRGRFARALVAMVDQGFRFGLGIDENSAVVIRGERDLHVIGFRGALVFDLSQARHDPDVGKFNLENARLTFLDQGDRFDLETRAVIPSLQKLEDETLDPRAAEFQPALRSKLFYNDILANTTVKDVMSKLMDTADPEAIGLAFDGEQARHGPTDGFEFRFLRDDDSIAWYSEASGGDDYTILRIRVDIRPIHLPGPLYRYAD